MIRKSNRAIRPIESCGWWNRSGRESGEWADEGELKWQ